MAGSQQNRPAPKGQTKPAARKSSASAGSASDDEMADTQIGGGDQQMAETKIPDSSSATGSDELAGTVIQQTSDAAQPKGAAGPTKKTAAGGKKKVTQLGDFRLIKKLGQGGMGTVYLANQVSLDRKVALKTLSKELAKNKDLVQRFIREARSMARLQHPNIVQVYAADTKSGVHFAAIEYVDGKSMQDWMNDLKRLGVGDALHVTMVCCDALRHAHELNMIHRDIKPDNILVTSKGVVKVADFGLAKALDEDVSMTQSGTGLGTPLYMAPEQARNAKHVDQRSDIYALGCTLYYFLTGQLPFTGETTLELITAKEQGTFTSARRIIKEVPERLDLMIDKMMAKDPQHRYASVDEIVRDLQSLNLDSPSLSFIDGSAAASVSRPAARARSGPGATATKKRPGPPITSAQDAERAKMQTSKAKDKSWFVQHTDASGKRTVSKMSTVQILAGLKSEALDLRSKAKASAEDSFLPLGQYPEFSSIVERRALQEKAQARSAHTQKIYSKIDKQERRRKRWRWLRNLVDNVKGLISLVIYLAIIGGAIFAAIKWGLPLLQQTLSN